MLKSMIHFKLKKKSCTGNTHLSKMNMAWAAGTKGQWRRPRFPCPPPLPGPRPSGLSPPLGSRHSPACPGPAPTAPSCSPTALSWVTPPHALRGLRLAGGRARSKGAPSRDVAEVQWVRDGGTWTALKQDSHREGSSSCHSFHHGPETPAL